MEYPKYYGNYLGIVVQNNDPLHRGRVKVFVPHISPTIYKGWVESIPDKKFRFPGANTGSSTQASDLNTILGDLKEILPWAEVAAPLAGESSSGRYNATVDEGSTSDSSKYEYTFAGAGDGGESSGFGNLNLDLVGEKPGSVFDNASFRLRDAFATPAETNINYVNKLSYNYVPETYSNAAKGVFAIPSVGAHVWVFFNHGDPLKPVIFAAAFGGADWCSIFYSSSANPGEDYPGSYENVLGEARDINVETYRNKYVINQKGGTLQFVNTDNRELLKLTHYSGSFKEFNNLANIELATNNDQKLVLNDSFFTVRGTRNEFSQRDYDCVVGGDHYRKVGNLRSDLYLKWREKWREIANIKQLFDIQRTLGVQGTLGAAGTLISLNGEGQSKSGTEALCPVCSGNLQAPLAVNTTFNPPGYKIITSKATTTQEDGDGVGGKTLTGDYQMKYQNGKPVLGYGGKIQVLKNLATFTDIHGNVLVQAPGTLLGDKCPCCNNEKAAAAGGIPVKPGFSQSSFGGIWTPEPQKEQLPTRIAALLPELGKLEAQMGMGGSEIIEITKHKVETIGTVMNDYGAVRVDPLGKMEPAYVIPLMAGTVAVNVPSPLVEQVQVDDLPGGTYSLNVCNRYNVLVGAGGINFKSYGVINIGGAMVNIAGEAVNIGSANEVCIDGGKRLSLVGDIVSLRQRNGEQVIVDSPLGINGNVIIKGGLFVEGNLGAISMSVPPQVAATDALDVTAAGKQGAVTGATFTCDYSHGYSDTGELVPGTGAKKTYLGYTDKQQVVAFIPEGKKIGKINAGTTTSTALWIIPMSAPTDLDVFAIDNRSEVEPLIDPENPRPLTEAGTYFLGTGYEDGTDPEDGLPAPQGMSIRGRPKKYVQEDMLLAIAPGNAGWKAKPITKSAAFGIGNGSSPSAYQVATHTSGYKQPPFAGDPEAALTPAHIRKQYKDPTKPKAAQIPKHNITGQASQQSTFEWDGSKKYGGNPVTLSVPIP